MSANELCFMAATDVAKGLRAREVSTVELIDVLLERIASPEAAALNAFTLVLADSAREAAREAERKLLAGEELGPLHGVPFTIKDLTPTAGLRTEFGSRAYRDHIPKSNAPVVDRMLTAGGIMLGKTTTPEFGNKGTTESPLSGVTRNPWNLSRTSGGSSGGAAAAVAAGLAPLAQGSDGGGSIRIPAACCGVVGLKPSRGLVPFLPEDSVYETLTHHGPLARTVADAALMLGVIAGPHRRDPFAFPDAGIDYLKGLEGAELNELRIGLSPDLGMVPVDPDVTAAVEEAARVFTETLGAEVEVVDLDLREAQAAMLVMWSTSLGVGVEDLLLPRVDGPHELDPAIVRLREKGRTLSAMDYYRAAVVFRGELYQKMSEFFDGFDLLLTPTIACAAFPHQGWQPGPGQVAGRAVDPLLGWILTYPFNMTGMPAISVPCGFSSEHLPIGLQIAGPHLADLEVLRAAAAYELVTEWSARRPAIDAGEARQTA